jgi:hypothetical protein
MPGWNELRAEKRHETEARLRRLESDLKALRLGLIEIRDLTSPMGTEAGDSAVHEIAKRLLALIGKP